MSIRNIIAALSITLLLASCTKPKGTTIEMRFDLKSCLEQQMTRLNTNQTGLKKTITAGGKRETRQVKAPDWQQELKPMLEIPFNQAAWDNAFTCDTVKRTDITLVQYRTTDAGIPLHELIIRFTPKDTLITARTQRKNLWFTLNKTLQYSSKNGYSFTFEQHTLLGNPEKIIVEGRFNHPSAL